MTVEDGKSMKCDHFKYLRLDIRRIKWNRRN